LTAFFPPQFCNRIKPATCNTIPLSRQLEAPQVKRSKSTLILHHLGLLQRPGIYAEPFPLFSEADLTQLPFSFSLSCGSRRVVSLASSSPRSNLGGQSHDAEGEGTSPSHSASCYHLNFCLLAILPLK
jgi:hypothetical protein